MNQSGSVIRETPLEFAKRLDLRFHDNLLLRRALTHRSYMNEHAEALEDNERLEFLGDAVLDFLVGAWLYNHYPEMPEGDLTRMRSALVHTEQLAEFARQIRLGDVLLLGKGEVQAGGRSRSALLCDAFEALIGAIYLDSGIDAVLVFISRFLDDTADDLIENHRLEDPKSALQEWAQAQGFPPPEYIVRRAFGPDHSKIFDVDVMVNGIKMGSGEGSSKHAATKEAARAALRQIG